MNSEKCRNELAFWDSVYKKEYNHFGNSHYQKLMCAIAQGGPEVFDYDIVADFGCGPRGSLAWMDKAFTRIGIDVLANTYFNNYRFELEKHKMIYVQSSEHCIPISDNSIDDLFTINSLDHVANLQVMCSELTRILKSKEGWLFGSFNLYEPPTATEPQILTPEILAEYLLKDFDVMSYCIGLKGPEGNPYKNMFEKQYVHEEGKKSVLWVTAVKK